MSSDAAPSLLLVMEPTPERNALTERLQPRGYRIIPADSAKEASSITRSWRPDLLLADLPHSELAALSLCRRFKADSHLQRCYILLVTGGKASVLADDADDILSRPCGPGELEARLRVGARFAEMLRRLESANAALERSQEEAARNEAHLNEVTTTLVEMTAQLQAEIYRNEALQAEQVRLAKGEMLVQSAVALHHEINNPLFAILGSAESALKRARSQVADGVPGAEDLVIRIERTLRGAERIRQVVQAFSRVVAPATKDYLPGIPMLELPKTV